MCTVQSIKDAIRENCQSQYDMESTDIDRVLQTLPFSGHESLFDQPPLPKRPRCSTSRRCPSVPTGPGRTRKPRTAERHSLFHERLWLFSCPENRKE